MRKCKKKQSSNRVVVLFFVIGWFEVDGGMEVINCGNIYYKYDY